MLLLHIKITLYHTEHGILYKKACIYFEIFCFEGTLQDWSCTNAGVHPDIKINF